MQLTTREANQVALFHPNMIYIAIFFFKKISSYYILLYSTLMLFLK